MSLPALIDGGSRSDLPLGTAQWLTFPKNARPVHKRGDLYIGHLADGESEGVGIRDDGHALVCARTRMGKGTSFIIPNLLTWPGSVFVIDPKGENARVTARHRGQGSKYCRGMKQKTYLLDPMNAVKRSDDDFADLRVGFNPLDMLHIDSDEVLDDAARIADALIASDQQNADPFWEDSARMLLRSLILHVATWPAHAHERNLVTVRRLLVEGDQTATDLDEMAGLRMLFDTMRQNKAIGGIIASAGSMLEQLEHRSPRTSGSIFQVAITNTDFIDSPPMRRSLSSSGFALSELKTDPKGVSIFVCLEDRFMGEHFRWLRMLTSLAIAEMERIPTKPASGHAVLTILDEFAALKRMRHIETAAANVAGYGMKLVFIVQALSQIKHTYGDNWETFVANCGVQLFWGNADMFTKEYVSRMLGEMEVGRTSSSSSRNKGTSTSSSSSVGTSSNSSTSSSDGWSNGGSSSSSSASYSEGKTRSSTSGMSASESATYGSSESVHKRPLLSPEEVGRIFGDPHEPRALALISGRPLYMKRWHYFQLECFDGYYEAHAYDAKVKLLSERLEDRARREAAQQQEARRNWELRVAQEQQRAQQRRAMEERFARLKAKDEEKAAAELVENAKRRKETERVQRMETMMAMLIMCGVVGVVILWSLRGPLFGVTF